MTKVGRSFAVVLVVLIACSRSELTFPGWSAVPYETPPFPDSITKSRGLPLMAMDSTAKVFGDTVVRTWVSTTAAWVRPAMQLTVRMLVRDTSSSVLNGRTLALDQCPFVLRLHRAVEPSTAPVWRSDRAAGVLRCPTFTSFGSSFTDVTASWDVASILGDSLPAGRYAFSYAVRTADQRTLEFASSAIHLTGDPTPPSADLSAVRFEAFAEIVDVGPRMLRVVATMRNTGARPVQFSHGTCNPLVRLYRNAERSGSPVWRSEYRRPSGNNVAYACADVLYRSVLLPGDSVAFPVLTPMHEITADSLAAGRYYVNAALSLIDETGSAPDWQTTRTLPAGAVDVTRGPDRLPNSRTIDGLTFTATTRLVRGIGGSDTIRTLVLVTNSTTVRRTSTASRDCPVVVYAYRAAALRDSVPMQEPAPYPNGGCSINHHPFALDPGQSWVFGRDVPVSQVSGGQHLWFTAWLPLPHVVIAAGDVEVPR